MMKLEELRIQKIDYGEREGQYEITVEFQKKTSKPGQYIKDTIIMHIDEKFHDSFITHCNEAIQEAAAKSAKNFFNKLDKVLDTNKPQGN